jgi:hypothetical protein
MFHRSTGSLALLEVVSEKTKRPVVRRWGRLKLVGAGIALILFGAGRIARAVQVVTNGWGQPMFSWALIAGGAICILFAGIPAAWIEKATSLPSKRHGRGQLVKYRCFANQPKRTCDQDHRKASSSRIMIPLWGQPNDSLGLFLQNAVTSPALCRR